MVEFNYFIFKAHFTTPLPLIEANPLHMYLAHLGQIPRARKLAAVFHNVVFQELLSSLLYPFQDARVFH